MGGLTMLSLFQHERQLPLCYTCSCHAGAMGSPDVCENTAPVVARVAFADDFLIDSRSLAMCWRFLLQVLAIATLCSASSTTLHMRF